MKIWIAALITCCLNLAAFANEAATTPDQETKTKNNIVADKEQPQPSEMTVKIEEEKTEEVPEVKNPWYLGASLSLLNFSSVGYEDIQYDIDSNFWTSLQGSYKFRSGLRIALNANFDTKLVKNGLKVAGQLGSDDFIVHFISGKFTGSATLTDTFDGNTYTQSESELSTKYLSVDLLITSWAFCDSCIGGFRYLQYDYPAEVGFNTEVVRDGFASILDPALRIEGVMYVENFSTQRDFVMGAAGSASRPEKPLPKGVVQGKTQTALLGSNIAVEGHVGLGYGVATISDQGKSNLASATSGRTFEEDSTGLLLYETSVAFLWAYNGMNKGGSRWSAGLGYMFKVSSAFSSLEFDDPSSSSQATISDVSVGYTMHGPRANFYMVF